MSLARCRTLSNSSRSPTITRSNANRDQMGGSGEGPLRIGWSSPLKSDSRANDRHLFPPNALALSLTLVFFFAFPSFFTTTTFLI